MGQLFEIIFFAMLSAYIFYRLWSVLGQESDEDTDRRDKNRPSEDFTEEDNVIPMQRKRERPSFSDEEVEQTDISLKQGVRNALAQVQAIEPRFSIRDFLKGSKAAYEIIIQAFSKGDMQTLESLLTEKVYNQFKLAVDQRAQDGVVMKTEIERLDRVDIDSITVEEDTIKITVRYHSRQIIVTQKASGEIIDNPAEISIPITDIWTYTRKVNDPNPNWRLSATASESYRD